MQFFGINIGSDKEKRMDKKQLHVVELTAENVKQYAGYLPEDEEENVGRFFSAGFCR